MLVLFYLHEVAGHNPFRAGVSHVDVKPVQKDFEFLRFRLERDET